MHTQCGENPFYVILRGHPGLVQVCRATTMQDSLLCYVESTSLYLYKQKQRAALQTVGLAVLQPGSWTGGKPVESNSNEW